MAEPFPLEPSLWSATAPPAPPTPPLHESTQADVCVNENTMTIWGHDRTWLWDQAGLRTITLARMPAN